jgi:transketolase
MRALRWRWRRLRYTLWQDFLRYDPADPLWPNRDRFVLSAGHASLLLYSLLHLSEVKRLHDGGVTDTPAVSLDDIKKFRQLDSVKPGHPEYGITTGVETITGPLGQGCGRPLMFWLHGYRTSRRRAFCAKAMRRNFWHVNSLISQ